MSTEVVKIGSQVQKLRTMTTADVFNHIRWSEEQNKGSVYDIIKLVSGCTDKNVALYHIRLTKEHPAVLTKCKIWKFPGERQRDTPIADAATLVEIAYLCPGKGAAQFRRQSAELLCRHLAGDLSLVDEIVARHQAIDNGTQEKLLSGTSSSPEQANSVPKTFKQISEGDIIFKQPMLYFGQYKELSGPDSVKIGQSNNIFQRIKNGDQAERMLWHRLLPMPNQKMLNQYEDALKMFAKEHNILAKKNEYIDPHKLGMKLGSTEMSNPQKAIDALLGIMAPQFHEGQNMIRVGHADLLPTYEEAVSSNNYAVGPINTDSTLKELPFYDELAESFKKCLGLVSKDKNKPVSELLEIEKEKTKQMECEMKIKQYDLMIELSRKNKCAAEIKDMINCVFSQGNKNKEEGISDVPGTLNNVYEQARDYLLIKTEDGGVHRDTLIDLVKEWLQKEYKTFKIPGRNELLKCIDISLVGAELDSNKRRFTVDDLRIPGWPGWKLK